MDSSKYSLENASIHPFTTRAHPQQRRLAQAGRKALSSCGCLCPVCKPTTWPIPSRMRFSKRWQLPKDKTLMICHDKPLDFGSVLYSIDCFSSPAWFPESQVSAKPPPIQVITAVSMLTMEFLPKAGGVPSHSHWLVH